MPRLDWRLYEAGHCTHPEAATRRGGTLHACEFPALVARLIHPEHGIVLFDTGYSRHFMEATAHFPESLYRRVTPVHLDPDEAFAAQLARDGIAADAVGWIVVSHLHGDHVGGLRDFDSARIACARDAWDDLRGRSRLGALRCGLLPALVDARAQERLCWIEDLPAVRLDGAFAPFGIARDLFGDRSALLVPLPGHAAGHYGLLFEDTRGELVFLIADAAWSSQAVRDAIPPPAFVTAWLGDTRAYRHTLGLLHALHVDAPQVRIVPSHCREWRPRPATAHG